ncbi:ovalbumin-related protein X isoform B [Alligator mississippiensis]|uniref:Ovalbumin-related protein X isoform B n=1 Tax=Alligator mississippiensis TaxID=8496 RepID=A0A151MNW5_ALLMI|nr:ovalbumin-related protein X isoform B [Alligator mississippiensis]
MASLQGEAKVHTFMIMITLSVMKAIQRFFGNLEEGLTSRNLIFTAVPDTLQETCIESSNSYFCISKRKFYFLKKEELLSLSLILLNGFSIQRVNIFISASHKEYSDFTMGSISAANADFCFDLFRVLKPSHTNANILYSPLNILSALAMVYLGAKGNTASQMEKVLNFDEVTGLKSHLVKKCGDPEDIHFKFKQLLSEINVPNANYTLRIANRLYADKTHSILPQYLQCTKRMYQACLESVNFKTAAEEARIIINSWVENKTNGLIKDLFGPGSIGASTAMILVNAIYFKGNWSNKFEEKHTKEMPFTINQQETKPVQMMHQIGFFKIASIESEKIQILELPYANGEMSMIILLPNDISDLDQLENTIYSDKLTSWMSSTNMEERKVEVHLPQMKFVEQYSLASVLSSLGMTDLFTQLADLSGISKGRNLKVSEVIHKSYVEVNEEGTEAAASTGVTGEVTSLVPLIEFKANHPFLFFICHKKTNLILFYGRFSSP